MKRKITKIFILILAFIVLIPVVNVRAAEIYQYKSAKFQIHVPGFKINNGSEWHNGSEFFWIHEVYQLDKNKEIINNRHVYCLNVSQYANRSYCPTVERYDITNNINIIKLGENKTQKVKLLKQLLSVADYIPYNMCGTGDKCTIGSDAKSFKYKWSAIATQIIVWEIVEGARTDFNSNQPNIYNKGDSAYNKFITLYTELNTAYNTIIEKVNYNINHSMNNTAFNGTPTYTLEWNGSEYKRTIPNIGDYDESCTSDNQNVKVSLSKKNKTLTVSSVSEINSPVTITCQYTVGKSDAAAYYKFPCKDKRYQDLIKANQKYTYSAKLKVKTSSKKIRISKVDDTGQPLLGAKFSLYLGGNDGDLLNSYKIDLTNNTYADINVKKSGVYLLREDQVPNGKQKIPDTNISIDVSNGTASVHGGSGLITTSSSGDYIYINIINTPKLFSINKTDESGRAINGATFQIKNGNVPVNFTWNGSSFKYDISGNPNIVNPAISNYPISGLPDGEYSLVETAVPYPYTFSGTEGDRTVKFRIQNGDMYIYSTSTNNYSPSASLVINIKNYVTDVLIQKIGNDGVKLSGISFYLLDSTRTKKIKSVMTSAGNYNYSPDQNNGVDVYTTNDNGHIKLNYLPAGTYYFQEFSTGDSGYPVPEGEDALTKIEIEVTAQGVKVNKSTNRYILISNAKNQFNFYKVDEDGNYLTGGSFKIQKYNPDTGNYKDMAIKKLDSNGNDTYKFDPTGDKFIFSINKGVVTFKEVESSTKYRIVELEAPEGFTKSNIESENQLVIEVNSKGYVKSSTTLVNKKTDIKEGAQASAELIINISTGQNRIRYILIIGILLLIITGLFIISRKMRRK